MKTIYYNCNLCREKKEVGELMCMYWECGVIPQRWVLSSDLQRSDNHICTNCIDIISG